MTRPLRLTIYREAPPEWRVTLRASDGPIADTSTVTHAAPVFAPVAVTRLPQPAKPGKWRWTLRAGNGLKVDASTQGYARRADAAANIALVLGLDVTGLKPGDVATCYRYIGSGRAGVPTVYETEQAIRVEVR